MLNKVLVPLDGSQVSEEALPVAVKLVKAGNGSLLLMHAVTPSEYFSVTAAQYVQQERRRSAAYLQQLAERLNGSGLSIQERVITGEASREIIAEADRHHVDMIVMSSHGRSGIREWAFGSVAERVLRTTSLPVLVFRGGVGKGYAIRRIMIAFDGSEDALEAIIPAADISAATGASLVLVHVGKKLPPALPTAQKMLHKHGRTYDTRLLKGDPAETLLRALQDEKADLLALTTTGGAGKDHRGFGSVAERLLQDSGRPMLVVNTGQIV